MSNDSNYNTADTTKQFYTLSEKHMFTMFRLLKYVSTLDVFGAFQAQSIYVPAGSSGSS